MQRRIWHALILSPEPYENHIYHIISSKVQQNGPILRLNGVSRHGDLRMVIASMVTPEDNRRRTFFIVFCGTVDYNDAYY